MVGVTGEEDEEMKEGSANTGRYMSGAGNSMCKGLTTGRPSGDRDGGERDPWPLPG